MKRAPTKIPKASKEVVLEVRNMSNDEARFIVSNYYDEQEARKRADMQIRHLGDKTLPAYLDHEADIHAGIENQIKGFLEKFCNNRKVGQWCLAQHGVGPVITAGLIANIDMEWDKCPVCNKKKNETKPCDCGAEYLPHVTSTAGKIWRFAGMDPTCKWEKGQKRPWNANLKQICFHMGECFKRSSNHPDSFYGRFYRERKELLVQRNEAGFYAERAKIFVTKSTEVKATLAQGKLPAGNLDRQACNQTVKIFLSHLHAVMFWDHFGKAPPKPFAIAILGHANEVRIPHLELFPGFEKAYYGNGKAKKAA